MTAPRTDPEGLIGFRRSGLLASPELVAPTLLGATLLRSDGRSGVIVEVEAYGGSDDPASHAFRGPSPRNASMFGPPGRLYVYRSYGIHWCANIVTGPAGTAAAVLLRAVIPTGGVEAMRAARWGAIRHGPDRHLCSGPGRLTQAFGIGGDLDGVDVCSPASILRLLRPSSPVLHAEPILASPRIGISKATERPWRFVMPQPSADLLQ